MTRPSCGTLMWPAMLGNRPLGGKPEDLTRKMTGDIARWSPVVKSLNLKGE